MRCKWRRPFLTAPSLSPSTIPSNNHMKPGEYILESKPIEANVGRKTAVVVVRNTGDRPVQVGSHYHFHEVNDALVFQRDSVRGMRLNIPAGTSVRFEPGEEKDVHLVEFAGERMVLGHRGRGAK